MTKEGQEREEEKEKEVVNHRYIEKKKIKIKYTLKHVMQLMETWGKIQSLKFTLKIIKGI